MGGVVYRLRGKGGELFREEQLEKAEGHRRDGSEDLKGAFFRDPAGRSQGVSAKEGGGGGEALVGQLEVVVVKGCSVVVDPIEASRWGWSPVP